MGWFNQNKVTEGLRLQVNQLQNGFSSLRNNFSQALLGLSHDGKRNINEVYGYPEYGDLSGDAGYRFFYQLAKRKGIANRLTHGRAKSCWREGFEVYESDDDDAEKIFADEILSLTKRGVVSEIERADILNRIGSFSVLFVGIPDGLDPKEPVGKVNGNGFKSIYFHPFAYDGIEILKKVDDPSNPRFGLPELYQVQQSPSSDQQKDTTTVSMVVHWTRIIHINEGALDSRIEGTPYLEPIVDNLINLRKTSGGASEAYFRNAKGKTAFEVDKEFAANVLDAKERDKMDESAKKFTNDWQDHIYAAGAKVHAVNTPHASPKDTLMGDYWEISSYSGDPIRVLIGEGSGQLAGSEDQLAVNAIISDRQNTFCSQLVCNLFEILSMAGMVEWKDTYKVRFPKQSTVTEMQQVELDDKKSQTLLRITQAKSQVGGDEVDLRSAMDNLGLKDIDTDTVDM